MILPVCSVPASSGWNPYLPMVNAELSRLGVHVRRHASDLRGLRQKMTERMIFHFHWPSSYYLRQSAVNGDLSEWFDFLAQAQAARCPLVWTAHNVWPHDHTHAEVHRAARSALVSRAAHVITHSESAAEGLLENFGRPRRLSVLAHPCYVIEKNLGQRRPQRVHSGLHMLALGALRRYKNLEFLAEAFTASGRRDDCLLIAGPSHASYDPARLRALCSRDSRIRLEEGTVPETELESLLAWADVLVFAYLQISSSGTVILAQSYGKPVIAPMVGCLPEWVSPDTGELFASQSISAFQAALERLRQRDLEHIGAAARAQALRMTPSGFAQKVYRIYEEAAAA